MAMKVGAENRAKLITAIVLLAVAVLLLGSWLLSSGAPGVSTPTARTADEPTEEGVRSTTHAKSNSGKKTSATEARSLDPRLRLDWLKGTEDTKYEGNGRNIFQTYVEIPKPIVNPVQQQAQNLPPPGPPPPPPIDLKFFGFASRPGEAKRIFLSEGEDIFIAGEGQIVDRRYKVLHISLNAVEIEDVLNNNRQSIPLSQG
jgi:hypothetical protein